MPILRWTLPAFGFLLFACTLSPERQEVETYGYADPDSLVGGSWRPIGSGEIEFRKNSTFRERGTLRNPKGMPLPAWAFGSLTLVGHWQVETGPILRLQLDSCGGSDYRSHSCDSLVTHTRPIIAADSAGLDMLALASAVGDTLLFEILEYYKCLEEDGDWLPICYRRAEKPYQFDLRVWSSPTRAGDPHRVYTR